ncbi:MAG: hydroxysqualene dehydroxylase HpnE [Candidatus Bipolaricaulota bacterium]
MVHGAKVVIVGGGLAGISAAIKVQEELDGVDLRLVEKGAHLGGRAGSVDYRGHKLDVGQHLHVNAFEYYRCLLEKIGLSGQLFTQPSLSAEFRDLTGRKGHVYTTDLFPPLHLLPSLARFPFISKTQKLRAVIPALRATLGLEGRKGREISFEDWLQGNGVRDSSIDKLWNAFIVPTLNAPCSEVNVDMGMMILKRVLLDKAGGRLGYLEAPLSRIGDAAKKTIESRGGTVTTEKVASSIEGRAEGGFRVGFSDGDQLSADALVLAVPAYVASDLVSTGIRNQLLTPFWDLRWNPIINVHLFYDRPVTDIDFFGLIDGVGGWVFNVSWDGFEPGSHLCVSISDPGDLFNLPPDQLCELVLEQLEMVVPGARSAAPDDRLVIKRPRATILTAPGSGRLRPPASTPVDKLFFAGDWTDTGWPSTMEGAVRSGVNAGAEVIGEVSGKSLKAKA